MADAKLKARVEHSPKAGRSRRAGTNPAPEAVDGESGTAAADPWAPLLSGPWGEVYAAAKAQGLPPVTDLDAVAGDFWPEGESIEEFTAAIRAWREKDAEDER